MLADPMEPKLADETVDSTAGEKAVALAAKSVGLKVDSMVDRSAANSVGWKVVKKGGLKAGLKVDWKDNWMVDLTVAQLVVVMAD